MKMRAGNGVNVKWEKEVLLGEVEVGKQVEAIDLDIDFGAWIMLSMTEEMEIGFAELNLRRFDCLLCVDAGISY